MKSFKISRPKDHRELLVKNQATSLIIYERIITTLTKAKLTQRYLERLMRLVKKYDTVNGLRLANRSLMVKEASKKMIEVLKDRFAHTNSGYTRIIKMGPRRGDNAEMVVLELTIKTEAPEKIEKAKELLAKSSDKKIAETRKEAKIEKKKVKKEEKK
jgi:large subunit ribosomal protein L17